MINSRKNILICSPFLNSIGGTEIEAVLTAIYFYDSKYYKKVSVFSSSKYNVKLFKELIEERNIHFINYPSYFESKSIIYVNRILNKLGLKTPVLNSIFWFLISIKYSHFFILTYPGCIYFFPLFQFYRNSKKYIAKITMWHFKPLPHFHQLVYNKFTTILVFNAEQQIFWKQNHKLKNAVALDIMILNEKKLLGLPERELKDDRLIFGFFGRIAREKNIEDMIFLLNFLNKTCHKKCKLIVQGSGDLIYLSELESLVEQCQLSTFVTFQNEFSSPLNSHTFYSLVDIFLVTSKIEGGPMTALEAAAAGCYVMGYNIGAMQDRFGQFPNVVNQNHKSLCNSALAFLNLTTFEQNTILKEFRAFYVTKLSNASKGYQMNQLFI